MFAAGADRGDEGSTGLNANIIPTDVGRLLGRALIVDDKREVSTSLVLAFRVLGVRATSDHLVKPIDLEDIERVVASIKK